MAKCPICGNKLIIEEITVNGQVVEEHTCSNKKCNYFRLY